MFESVGDLGAGLDRWPGEASGVGAGDGLGEVLGEGFVAWLERLDESVDPDVIAVGFAVRDRLSCVLTGAVGRVDVECGYVLDGAVSLRGWLEQRARLEPGEATRTGRVARRLRRWPAVRAVWESGGVSAGQVQVIVNLVGGDPAFVDLFAEQETAVVAGLCGLSVFQTAVAMRRWRQLAEQELDSRPSPVDPADGPTAGESDAGPDQQPSDSDADGDGDGGPGAGPGGPDGDLPPVVGVRSRPPRQSLFLAAHFEGRWALNGDLNAEGGSIVRRAIDLAVIPDPEFDITGLTRRLSSEHNADALVEICRFYLEHRHHGTAKPRNRPHINIVVDLPYLAGQAGRAETIDGLPLDRATIERLLCDADIHRVITDGPSVILDYGRATRTATIEQWNALLVRDRHCTWPAGCDVPANRCHAHHEPAWNDGGTTDLAAMRLLCTGHHWLRHQPGWTAKLLPDTTYTVTSPHGKTFTSKPRC
jgi:Domain of unknown function (DUF222)